MNPQSCRTKNRMQGGEKPSDPILKSGGGTDGQNAIKCRNKRSNEAVRRNTKTRLRTGKTLKKKNLKNRCDRRGDAGVKNKEGKWSKRTRGGVKVIRKVY